ncbi:MAG: flagellar protein FliT [Dehalococcoidia bacterium]|nr:MAG: flagellar protein FliT [Dehalococcoidia bacterium]
MGSAALQFELLREIFDLARAQRAGLESDDLDRVMDLMTEREVLLGRLQRLTEEQTEVPPNVVPLPRVVSSMQEDALALDTVIRSILEHDRANEALLREKLAQVRDELPRLRRAFRAANAYRPSEVVPAYLNRRS